jgi:serine/threonine-protein kinase
VTELDSAARLWRRVSRALDEVYDLEGDARIARLERLLADEPEVHREVLALLAADPGTSRILDQAARDAAAALPETLGAAAGAEELAPQSRIGGWRLLGPVGRGGMGEVFLAERADGAYEQRAALKLLKRGLDSDELYQRFLRERQILARLVHPGIARLLDGGVASDGRPFFVLEYVEGRPITEHADAADLGVEERLRLFLEVCAAVEAAHRSLVVHRDLKPSNILVSAGGEVKLLDFGIAKLLEDEPDTVATRTGLRLMTPAYAAPEQILGGDVTTATDVFALGAVLYELTAGRRPFERSGRTPTDLAREVERERVERPSETAERRARAATDPETRWEFERRAARIAGDLDAILLQALESDPRRRYPTVEAFAADLRRHLDGRPVRARASTFSYRAGKFVRRHRLALGVTATILMTLLTALAVAVAQAARAEREAGRARRVREFLVGMFEAADPTRSLGDRLSARDLVEQGVTRIDRDFVDDPRVHAELLDVAARTLWQLDRPERARPLAERSVAEFAALDGPEAPRTLMARLTRAEIDADSGRLESTVPELERLRTAIERAFDPSSAEVERVRLALSYALNESGQFDRALEVLRAASESVDRRAGGLSLASVQVHQGLGAIHFAQSRKSEAEAEYRRALEILEQLGGRSSATAVPVLSSLGELLGKAGRGPESLELQREAVAVATRVHGERSPIVARVLLPYGYQLSESGRRREAAEVYRQAAEIFEREGHFNAAAAWRYLGQDQLAEEKLEDALDSFERAERLARGLVGDDHFMTWGAVQARADALVKLGRRAEAEPLQRSALAAFERLFGPDGDFVRIPLRQLGENLRGQGRITEATALHRRARSIEEKLFGDGGNASEVATLRELALDLLASGDRSALAEARAAVDLALARLGSASPNPLRAGDLLVTSARVAEAEGDRNRARRDHAAALALLEPERGESAPSVRAIRAALSRLSR